MDDRSARIARQFPGYGGYTWGGGYFTLQFTDTAGGRAVADTIWRLEKIETDDTLSSELRPVRWDFAQLYDWYYYLAQKLRKPNSYQWYINQHRNRLFFHVSDTVTKREVEAQLRQLNVPCDLVKVVLPGEAR